QPARRERPSPPPRRRPERPRRIPPHRIAAALGTPRGLRDRCAVGHVAGQGPAVRRDPARRIRRVHGLRVRPEPQGNALDRRRRRRRLPTPPGPHLPQRARRHPDRPTARRSELPDRTSPVPEHAATVTAPRATPRALLLHRPAHRIHRDLTARLLRPRPAAPQPTRRAAAPANFPGHKLTFLTGAGATRGMRFVFW